MRVQMRLVTARVNTNGNQTSPAPTTSAASERMRDASPSVPKLVSQIAVGRLAAESEALRIVASD